MADRPTRPRSAHFALARAYLGIVRTRLGDRLEVHADAPGEACSIRMPAMMLLPLVDQVVAPGWSGAKRWPVVRGDDD